MTSMPPGGPAPDDPGSGEVRPPEASAAEAGGPWEDLHSHLGGAGDEADSDVWGYGTAESPAEVDEVRAAADRVTDRRLRDLRDRLDRLEGRTGQTREQLARVRTQHADLYSSVAEEIAPKLEALWELSKTELGQLRAAVEELFADRDQQDKVKNPPVNWIALTEDQAREQWPVLARWVGEVLAPWYELTRDQLPDCWAMHTPVVIELSWLRSAHRQAYLPHTHPHITAEWHARWRPFLMNRIKELTASCKPGEHAPDGVPSLSVQQQAGPPRGGLSARAQISEVGHWWPFYQHAFHADLARRRTRGRAGVGNWTPAPPPGG